MGTTLADTLAEAQAMADAQNQRQAAPAAATPSASPAPTPVTPSPSPPAPSGGGMGDTLKAVGKNILDVTTRAAQTVAGSKFVKDVQADPTKTADKVLASTAMGIVRSPMQLLGGAIDTGADIGKFIGNNIEAPFVRRRPSTATTPLQATGQFLQGLGSSPLSGALGGVLKGVGDRLTTGASLADAISARKTLGQVGYPALNQFTTEGVASTIPLAIPGVAEAGLVTKMGVVGAGAAVGMSAKSLKGRLINAGAGAAIEGGVGLIGKLAKTVIKAATPEEAAQDALDRTFASQRTSEALDQAAEVQQTGKPVEGVPQEELADGTRHTDVAASGGGSTGPSDVGAPPSPIAQSADHLLEKAGAAERIPEEGPTLDATGKIVVKPETLEALDDAGIDRRAFAAKVDGPPMVRIYRAEGDASGVPQGTTTPGHRWFTTDLDVASKLAANRNGEVHYLDIPQDQAETYFKGSHNGEVPEDIASSKTQFTDLAAERKRLQEDGFALNPNDAKAHVDERAKALPAAGEKPIVIFKEEAEDGSSRVVGSMGKSDLDAFTEEVMAHREAPEDIDLPNGSPSGQWKMAHLGAPYDAASVLRAMVDRLPKSAEPMKDADMMAAARDMADHFGATAEDALAFARHVTQEDVAHPVVMKALQTIWKRLGEIVDDHISAGHDWATADQETADAARRAIHDLMMFSSVFRDAKGIPGRTMRVLDLPDADSYLTAARQADRGTLPVDPALQDEMPALPRTRDELKNWLDQWDALKGDPAARARFLDKIGNTYPSGQKYLRNSLANFFTGMILSGPKTILLNVLGPAFMGGLRTLERTAGGALMAINPLASAADRAAGAQMALHAPVAYVQTLGDVATAFKYAAETFNASRGMLEGEGHFPLDVNVQGVNRALIAAAQADGKTTIPYHLGNLLNVLPRAVWRLHGTTNEFALHMAYMGEVRAKAMLDAATQGLEGPAFRAHVLDAIDAATDNATGAATDAASLDSAMRTTMVRQADPEMAPMRASFDKTVQSWRKNFPELRYVLPIFQVPANSIGESIRRIPGAGFLLKETQQELSGSLGQFRQADAYGRVLLGAGFLSAGAMMARQGLMTGAGPQDASDRKVWLTTHQPYSFKAGDQWVGYDRMEPVGPLLAIAAGFSDTSVYHSADQDHTFAAVGALAQYLKDKAAVQGVADLLNFGGDPRDQATLMNRAGGIAKGFTVPAFLMPARSGLDPDLRVKRTPWDYITDAMPGMSTKLDPVRNILGEDVHKATDTFMENLLPISTAPTTIGKDPVLDEIDRLYEKTGYTPGALSPSAGAQAHFDLRDIKAEDGHSIYDHLMKARQTTTVDGQTLRETLKDLFDSPEYNDASDGTGKVDDGDGGPREDTRGGMVQKVFSTFTKQAKADVASQSPTARKWMAAAVAKDHANDVLRGTSAKELVQGLSIDLTPFEDKLTEGAN